MSIDGLVRIEKELMGGLLRRNYNGLKGGDGQRCAELVTEYVALAQTVRGKPVVFIKQLTKVAEHIANSGHSLDQYLEKLYRFNIEGVQEIEGLGEEESVTLEAHLLSHAGNAAKALFERTKKVEWAEKWYEGRLKSAKMSEELDPRHSAYAYSFAGNAAKALFERTKKVEWAEKWYEANMQSAGMAKTFNLKHSAHAYGFAGDAAKAMSGDLGWAKKAICCYTWFIDYYESHPNGEMSSIIQLKREEVHHLEEICNLSKQ